MRFFSFIQRQGQILRWFRVWLSRLFVWFTVKISLICLCTRPGFIWCFLPEFVEGKVRNLDAHFTVTVIYRQEDKAPWMLQTEDTSVCLHDLFWRQCRGGQKCMSRVRRSLWITFLRIKPHSAHGSASQAPGVRAIRNFLHTSGCAWLLCCLCSPTACADGNAVTHILQPNLQHFQKIICCWCLCTSVFPYTLSKNRSNSRMWVCVLGWSSIPVDAPHINMASSWQETLLVPKQLLKDTAFVSKTLLWRFSSVGWRTLEFRTKQNLYFVNPASYRLPTEQLQQTAHSTSWYFKTLHVYRFLRCSLKYVGWWSL